MTPGADTAIAVEKVKGLLKGMFRRGKKSKTQAQPQQQQPETGATATPPPPPPPPASVAPATSPYTTTSTAADNVSSPNTDKQLPRDKAQPAVPVEKTTQPEAVPAVKKESDIHAVSAASATPAVPPAPSAAFESDPAPAVPPKNDGTIDAVKPIEPTGTAIVSHQ